MKSILITILLLSFNFITYAQSNISGKVIDKNGESIIGANVYLQNTYDGGFSDETGSFSYESNEKGVQTLVVSFISYSTFNLKIDVSKMKNLKVILKQEINELKAVTITAGTFETGDNSKTAVLNPIDVVTTAGAEAGDINSAIKTLPGIQTVGEDGRLFVRGGDASETKVYIDGMHVFKPYLTTNSNTTTRSRFSSFLFKGVAFSSGGYSSEYGDALSGVLSMNTTDFPIQSKTDISIMTVGLGLGKTNKWKNDAISVSINYLNLGPYKELFPDRYKWIEPYSGLSGEGVYRHKFKTGLFKLYLAGTKSNAIINRYDINYNKNVDTQIKNDNIYLNYTFKGSINKKNAIFIGSSLLIDKANYKYDVLNKQISQYGHHTKAKITHIYSNQLKLSLGAEIIDQKIGIGIKSYDDYEIKSKQYAGFSELKYLFSENLVAKIGLRSEYSKLLDKWNTAPRISLAYKLGQNGQLSLAVGKYFQMPDMNYRNIDNLKYENTDQYILNYSYKNNNQILRVEGYYKKYNDLVLLNNDIQYNNLGNGYSKGIDIFWKDKKTFRFLEYWLSYSLLDAKKLYKDFPELASPGSASKHNLSIVAKYWLGSIRSYPGITYTYSSPRPYNNPNNSGFMAEKTKAYNNLSLTWTYLISQQKILFFSFSNILGFENEYGYEYARQADLNGKYRSNLITSPSKRSVFVGFFWTISDDNKSNQLDRL